VRSRLRAVPTPYLTEAQITSGTLAYAFGAGNAVISTPYWHAAELLTADRASSCPSATLEPSPSPVVELLRDEPLPPHDEEERPTSLGATWCGAEWRKL